MSQVIIFSRNAMLTLSICKICTKPGFIKDVFFQLGRRYEYLLMKLPFSLKLQNYFELRKSYIYMIWGRNYI